MRPAANTTDVAARLLPVRIARMEPRYELDVLAIGLANWDVAAGPIFQDEISRGFYSGRNASYVALDGRRVVGYLSLRMMGQAIVIRHLAVSRPYWRRGIGSQLVRHAKAHLWPPRFGCLAIEVAERNTRAQVFLRAVGFECLPPWRRSPSQRSRGVYRFVYELPTFDGGPRFTWPATVAA
jgi:ribosomal protein S18 acetylase RimI-like enzyme